MGYIIKNTSGLVNTRITDVGRRYISQGNFNISYFQIGDSEVNYGAQYNITGYNVLMPAFNAQNDVGTPQSNKENVKYPIYVEGVTGNTYGIPFMDSNVDDVYNSQVPFGFFLTGNTYPFSAQTSSAYTVTSNYVVELNTLSGQTSGVQINLDYVAPTSGTPSIGDFITIYFDGNGFNTGEFETGPVLTYKIQDILPATGTTGTTTWTLTLDRSVPIYTGQSAGVIGRCLIYPSGMTELYDTLTPAYLETCGENEITRIWNMNIPWSESPAGVFSSIYESFLQYGSISYLSTKQYLGYQQNSGQTDTSQTFYYNSFDEKIVVEPDDQKCIAIVHYTNQSLDNVYGEKFATLPFDPQNPTTDPGLARNFKLTIPTLMWHKSTGSTIGEVFYIDPPGYDLCRPYYIKSVPNPDMNDPGIRYYHLYDTNPDANGNLNRIGKVFPDQEIVIIDDEEVAAALSYKSNRNWTLSAPQLSLITPNTCFTNNNTGQGVMNNEVEKMWVTYRFDSTGFTDSLHCNYYSYILGPSSACTTNTQNVAIRFGNEFPFLGTGSTTGYTASDFKVLCQIVSGDTRPDPTLWRVIDLTDQLSGSTVGGYINSSGMTSEVFQITLENYTGASFYNLANYINIPQNGDPDLLNFGDEYYFYGNLQTDIQATIYQMKYLVNLGVNQFTSSSNPTYVKGQNPYITEIGLYNSNKDLMIISKLQSPELRQGIQQFVVKLDF